MSPFCSRRRSPSARKRKSNFARSAVRAKCANEENSMWLPAAGSLQTGGLLTPGKWAARWICLRGMEAPLVSVLRCRPARRRRGTRRLRMLKNGVAVRGTGQSEQPPQGVGLVPGTEGAASLQLRHQPAGDLFQVVRQGPGTQPQTAEAGGPPFEGQVGELGRRPDEHVRVAAVLVPEQPVEPFLALGRRGGGGVEEHDDVAEHVDGLAAPA